MNYILEITLELGAIYSLVTLGLFISFRILNIADLTTDGCFVLGEAVSVSCAALGHPVWGIVAGMFAGGCAGFVTAFLHTHMGVPDILAGIITNTGLYTVNLFAMGWSANISLLKNETIYSLFRKTGMPYSDIVLSLIIVLFVMGLVFLFLKTRIGLSVRATGDNRTMVSASSISTSLTLTIGLVLANMMTGLSGALAGQYQKVADINSGTGIVVVGLASLIIGETILRGRKSIGRNILAVLAGNIVYRFIYAMILASAIVPVECLKLFTAVIVAMAISAPYIRKKLQEKQKMRNEVKRYAQSQKS